MRNCIYLIALLMLFFTGCCSEKSKPPASREPYFFSINEIKELKQQPEIVPDGPCYFKLDAEYESAYLTAEGFYYIELFRGEILKKWERRYINSSCNEYRLYCPGERHHYIIGQGSVDSTMKPFLFYIKWRQIKADKLRLANLPGHVLDSDIGKYTEYLETNLSREVKLKYFPDVKCSIVVTKPKRIKANLYHRALGNSWANIDPQIEYESAKIKR